MKGMRLTLVVGRIIKKHIRPDEGHLSVELAVARQIDVCSEGKMRLGRRWWYIIVGNDRIEGHVYGSCKLHL